ncbi:hypothetical protein Syun_020743 [Stephania yunnanensis]|uniref:Uncharacterized protein n=1 Tax=Stephania yunnanensis TaxID=152371 RepID=A0AAP0IEH2_9MAGN
MASAAAAPARALLLFRIGNLSTKPPPPPHQQLLISRATALVRPILLAAASSGKRSVPSAVVNCLYSGVDGGGVADEFVSTRKAGFDREFSVIANLLKRIEPLDTSVISKGVSDLARDSMKRTISTMLGLLPSDQFSVSIRVSRGPLDRLLSSSIITGYTLWNAEYRVCLMRNFDLSPDLDGSSVSSQASEVESMDFDEILEEIGDLSPNALKYIQQLKSELATAEKELNAQKEENSRIHQMKQENDLLEYLRSMEPDLVKELSVPSSSEVEGVIQELVENILLKLFKEECPDFLEASVKEIMKDDIGGELESSDTMDASRDYLAKLLFWLKVFVLALFLDRHVSDVTCREGHGVHAIGPSLEKLGKQVAPELYGWIIVKIDAAS